MYVLVSLHTCTIQSFIIVLLKVYIPVQVLDWRCFSIPSEAFHCTTLHYTTGSVDSANEILFIRAKIVSSQAGRDCQVGVLRRVYSTVRNAQYCCLIAFLEEVFASLLVHLHGFLFTTFLPVLEVEVQYISHISI